jgi:hypothetical protein
MHFAGRPIAARDPIPDMLELPEAWFGARRRSGEQWFLNVGIAAPIARDGQPRSNAGPD